MIDSELNAAATTDVLWPVTDTPRRLEKAEVQVWCCLLNFDAKLLDAAAKILSSEEARRASQFHGRELQNRFVSSRIIVRTILGGCLNIEPEKLEFVSDNRGKPHLVEANGIHFNLSHSRDLMLLAVAMDLSLGVDVERIRRLKDANAIAQRFFSKRESSWLKQRADEELDSAFFRLWTRKEAILKATGEGISSGIDSLELLCPDGTFEQIVARAVVNDSGSEWRLQELHPAAGYIGALALPSSSSGREVTFNRFTPT